MAISNAKGGYPVRRIVNATGRIANRRETLLNPTALNYINGGARNTQAARARAAYTLVSPVGMILLQWPPASLSAAVCIREIFWTDQP